MNLFGGDDQDACADGLEHMAGESKATETVQGKWRSNLSKKGKWTLYDLESALGTLQNYFLLQWRSGQRSYAMHKLVHAWSHDRVEAKEQLPLSSLALELMADAASKEEVNPSQRLRLVPHMMACFRAFNRVNLSSGKVGQDDLAMVDRISDFLYRIGR